MKISRCGGGADKWGEEGASMADHVLKDGGEARVMSWLGAIALVCQASGDREVAYTTDHSVTM